MGYHPRIELTDVASFQTTRCKNSEMWFANNEAFEADILTAVAKYATRYEVILYAFAIEGSHVQFPALYPNGNRANFMRDLNSTIARAVPHYVPDYDGGRLWQRRYSAEIVPGDEDIEYRFFYTVLQPIQDGHVEKLSQWPFYNCFYDAVHGIKRKFKSLDRKAYNDAKRWNKEVRLRDFVTEYTLEYKRLPGYEHLSQREYAKLMYQKLEAKRLAVLEKRRSEGKTNGDGSQLRSVRPGTRPRNTKTSDRYTHRPRILAQCPIRRAAWKSWYFDNYFEYKECSRRYRAGDLSVVFPPGMYKPPSFTIKRAAPPDLSSP